MNQIFSPLNELESFNKLKESLISNREPVLASGVIDSQKIHLSSGLLENLDKNGLFITFSESKAKEIYEDLKYFFGDRVKYYPSKDIIFYNADVRSIGLTKQRFEVIESLINNERNIIVLTVEALFDRLTDMETFKNFILSLSVGHEISVSDLKEKLIFMGFENTELVEGPGQFALRGGIIDLFPPNMDNAVRIEFWGDEIDSIRLLDSFSQRSIEKIESVQVLPMRELVYTGKELESAINKIKKELAKTLKSYEKKQLFEEAKALEDNYKEVIEKMENLKSFSGIERYSQYFYDDNISLLEYISSDTLVFVDEPNRISSHSETIFFEFSESIKNRISKGQALPSSVDMVYSYAEILKRLDRFKKVLLISITQTIRDFTIKEITNFTVKSSGGLSENFEILFDDLKFYSENNYRILILAGASVRGNRILRDLTDRGLSCEFKDSLDFGEIRKKIITISTGNLHKGFEYQENKFVVITDKEALAKDKKAKKKRKTKGSKIESFTDLKIGDYVVHESHGIGIYKGIEKIITDNTSRDYLKISYSDGGHLYVPTNQMDVIQKYIGGDEGAKIKLNKLGGNEWNKAKQKAKKSVEIIAKDLVELYAKRQAEKGYSFSPDTVWQKEFEELFPFEETEDQRLAIIDTKKDMESGRSMDRLICGDVGYGKTEIAIRAAFKAVQDGKQVAYLVPTTILAQQHFNTFVQRMSDFPINIEMLSRFRTKLQQKKTIEGINKGTIDIVIGTHRLLSKDINFRDLGLIVVDEEQRFGVKQKEKLKQLKGNVDVLSLSATPIPRTLHMSLMGIRDISILEEPPLERQPVQTYVMEYNDEFVRDAITRELGRDGQVFYLHNRVRNIIDVKNKVQKLVPDANVAFAHGQMSERELENIMIDFIEGEIEVLVCTTIIETGLDISNANTIIIQDADYMGLSQLYQLRGRVGRSSRSSFAYLMYRKDKALNEIAEKRLQTIREFTEFGSGFKIAMRDLEIRGAGNILGSKQHGHMDAIGYDMYCKLLDEEIKRLKGETVLEDFETSIDLKINAFIPSFYINNEEQKLEIYKKISYIRNKKDYYEVQEEIEDRYGNIPSSTQNLLDIAYIKSKAHKKDIIAINQKNSSIVINFKDNAQINTEKITELIKEQRGKLLYTGNPTPYLTYKLSNDENPVNIKEINDILNLL